MHLHEKSKGCMSSGCIRFGGQNFSRFAVNPMVLHNGYFG
jgi:hypothetical protein